MEINSAKNNITRRKMKGNLWVNEIVLQVKEYQPYSETN